MFCFIVIDNHACYFVAVSRGHKHRKSYTHLVYPLRPSLALLVLHHEYAFHSYHKTLNIEARISLIRRKLMKNVGNYIGNYRILALQRETILSQFYVVEHTFIPGGSLALQLWPGVWLYSESDRSIFLSRLRALINLQDLALLQVKDGDVEGGNPYLVLGYEAISSETLGKRLARRESEPLPYVQAMETLTQVGRALVVAHAHGVVHGQITSESVLLTPDGRVLLANFRLPFPPPESVGPAYRALEENSSKLDDQADLARLAAELLNDQSVTQSSGVGEALALAMRSDTAKRFATVRAFLRAMGITMPIAESPMEREGGTNKQAAAFFATASVSQKGVDTESAAASQWPQWGVTPPSPAPPSPRSPGRGRIVARVLGVLLALVLLFFGGNWLYSVLPAMSATVTIIPVRQSVQQTYNFTLAQTTDFTQKQIQSRVIKYITSQQQKTVKSSVTNGHIDAVQAHGQVVFSSVSRDVEPDVILSADLGNGLTLDIGDHGVISSQHATTVTASIEQGGSKGNIPAAVVNGTYDFSPIIGNPAPFTAFVSNPAPFTGGKDAYDGPIVQQQDINQAQSDLTTKLQNEAQQKIAAQLQTDESLLSLSGGGTMECESHVYSDHQTGDPAATVTVTEQMDCRAVAYNGQATLKCVQSDMQQQVQKSIAAHFGRVGDLQTTTSLVLVQGTQPTDFQFFAQGQWVLQLDAGGQQAVARGIEGLSQAQARSVLLRTFRSKTKSLVLSTFWGQHLPIDTNGIKVVGLAALPPGS